MNGSMGFLITDSGDHDPLAWATATADHLIHVSPHAAASTVLAAKKLELAVIDALVPHHTHVQSTELSHLAANGDAHLATELNPADHVEATLLAVVACAKDTLFEVQFADPVRQNVMRGLIASHFASSMHNARSWHVDKNHDGPHAKAFRAQHHGGDV